MKNNPIFVTGIERSGATIIVKILEHIGVYTGECSNMLENKKMKLLVDGYYAHIGADPKGQYPLPFLNDLPVYPKWWNKNVLHRIHPDRENWVYKSSRICQTWPLWNSAFPTAKWIIVKRRPGDIVQSCIKTGYMSAFKNETVQKVVGVESEREGWLWWVHQHNTRFIEINKAVSNVMFVTPDRMADGDFEQVKEMLTWLGLKWDDSIIKIVEPLLWKTIIKRKGK